MATPGRHPKNPINRAIRRLDPDHFTVAEIHKGHRWGQIICRNCGATAPIWSTPRVPEDNAHQIDRFAIKHTH